MRLLALHQQSGFALVATYLAASTFASPIQDAKLQPRQDSRNILSNSLKFWTETNFEPTGWTYQNTEPYREENQGKCYLMTKNIAKSAKAPDGYKCTIYSDEGCHGWRTREFNQDGLGDLGPKMNRNGESWRCCKIGTTNGWGYCDARLNEGTL